MEKYEFDYIKLPKLRAVWFSQTIRIRKLGTKSKFLKSSSSRKMKSVRLRTQRMKMKSVFLENFPVKYRKNTESNSSSLAFSNLKNFKEGTQSMPKKQKYFQTNGLSTEMLMKESKLLVTEKKEFVSRDELILLAHFGLFGLSKVQSKDQNKWFSHRIFFR